MTSRGLRPPSGVARSRAHFSTTPQLYMRRAFTCLFMQQPEKPQTKANGAYVCATPLGEW